MHLAIIANGFQHDYIIDLLNSLAGKVKKLDFIGSSFYQKDKLHPAVIFMDLRGSNDESASIIHKILRSFNYYIRLIKYLFLSKVDIIHVQWLRFNFLEGILFTLIARSLGIKVVYTAHDVLPHLKENIYNRMIFYIMYHLQNHIIVHTKFIMNRLMKEFNVPSSKLSLVKHGVYRILENIEITRTIAKSSFGLKESDKVILFFGIITKYKGLDILLNAFQEFHKDKPEYYLIIAGRVAKEYQNFFEKLMYEFDNSNIIKQLKFIEDNEKEILFKAADVIVLPYLEASQSGVLFMSYAYGRPVIAPDLGGFPNDIVNKKTGLLFTAGISDSLTETLKEFDTLYPDSFTDSEIFIKKHVKENYSWEASGKKLIETFRKIVPIKKENN